LKIASRLSRPAAAGLAYAAVVFGVGFALGAIRVIMVAEVTLAGVFFGRTVPEYLSSLATVPGAIGLAAQVAFGCFPLAQGGGARP
jgi:hypothetical protein